MRVAFLYNTAAEDPANMAEDGAPTQSPLVAALQELGHTVVPIACTLDLSEVRRELVRARPDVAFNRVESLGGSDALIAAITLLLDVLQIPYTGCPTESLLATASKLTIKRRMLEAGLPTPAWIDSDGKLVQGSVDPLPEIQNSRFIVKSVFEHASFEMDDASVVGPAEPAELARLIDERSAEFDRPFFAERFIEGREFNLSLLGDEPQVLPPAEIDFSTFPKGKPRIVGYGAKWDSDAYEYHNTPRRFDFPPADEPLLDRLRELAIDCWRLFGARGFARVDFRCDELGRPWILEINANPCLAPASGFAAALKQAGIGYLGGIQQIVDAALPHDPRTQRHQQYQSLLAR